MAANFETIGGGNLKRSSMIFFTSSPVSGLMSMLIFFVSATNSGSVRVLAKAPRKICSLSWAYAAR